MEEQIKQFENLIGGILPDDYKEFLINNNNREFKPLKYSACGTRLSSYVMQFYYVSNEMENNLFNVFKKYKNELLTGIIPIASTPISDLVVMSINKKDYGTIYHWEYSCEPEVIKRPSYKFMLKSANNFSEFYESLIPYEG